MSTIIFNQDQAVAEWVGNVTGKPFHPPYAAIGVINQHGTLTGGYVFKRTTRGRITVARMRKAGLHD